MPADFTLARPTEQHAVRNYHTYLAAAFLSHLDHVRNEGPVALAFGRDASPKTVIRVVGCLFGSPLVQREGRIGNHRIEFHQPVVFFQLRIAQRVAPANHRIVKSVQKHVHHGQCPGTAIHFLPVEREVIVAHLLAGLNQQGTGAAGRIADACSGLALGQPGQQGRDLGWCKKFSRLFPRLTGKRGDQIHVGISYDVVVFQMRLVQRQFAEVGQQILQTGIFSLGSPRLAELKLILRKMLLPSSLLIFSRLASSMSASAMSISSPILSAVRC